METTKLNKTQYSEHEAAQLLGVSIEELRSLVCTHIVHGADLPEQATYQASDLVVLRLLGRLVAVPERLAS